MKRKHRDLCVGLAFLAPNILGVLVFTVFPLLFSIVLAFSNWDLRLHNMFKHNPLDFVGLDNFIRLFSSGDLLKFLGNTLFFMMGIPFAIAGSLLAAMVLSKDLKGGHRKVYVWLLASGGMLIGIMLLTMLGMGASAMAMLMVGLVSVIIVLGLGGGQTVYRTLFYAPHFTAGVATYILWKKLYSPNTGAINHALKPVLSGLTEAVNHTSSTLFVAMGLFSLALMVGLFLFCLLRYTKLWIDSEVGTLAAIGLLLLQSIPFMTAMKWSYREGNDIVHWIPHAGYLWIPLVISVLVAFVKAKKEGCMIKVSLGKGLAQQAIFSLGMMTLQFIALGMGPVFFNLPEMASVESGLSAPLWLADYNWAKPALMFMGLWAAIGSNNMLLYLAALTNVPQDLYEAADIDGASGLQTFWNVTWPQLAPTTFFIFIMSVIGGLQGGMEMAKTMTDGGPAGSTTTLAYFIYTEGFETGRLGYSSAVAWTLFLLVFLVTMINWKFGNKKVND